MSDHVLNKRQLFTVLGQQTSPFKRPLLAGVNHSSTGAEAPSALQKDNAYLRPGGPASEVPNNDGTPMHSGQIPSIADVRSPDVLHSLSHPIMVSPKN